MVLVPFSSNSYLGTLWTGSNMCDLICTFMLEDGPCDIEKMIWYRILFGLEGNNRYTDLNCKHFKIEEGM